jgi:shikimate kinase
MRQSGTVVWLKALAATIHARMSGDATTAARRPSLTDKDPLAEIEHLLARREPAYREAAHWAIDTEGRTPADLTAEIIERAGLAGQAGESR